MSLSDRIVYRWAQRLWPDLPETWLRYREYYRQQFALALARGTATEHATD